MNLIFYCDLIIICHYDYYCFCSSLHRPIHSNPTAIFTWHRKHRYVSFQFVISHDQVKNSRQFSPEEWGRLKGSFNDLNFDGCCASWVAQKNSNLDFRGFPSLRTCVLSHCLNSVSVVLTILLFYGTNTTRTKFVLVLVVFFLMVVALLEMQ